MRSSLILLSLVLFLNLSVVAQERRQRPIKDLNPITRSASVDWESKLKAVEEVPAEKEQKPKKVTIFVTPDCSTCDKLRKFLKKHKVSYTSYDVSKDFRGQQEYTKTGASSIPVIKIDEELIEGFQPESIKAALKSTEQKAE